MIKLAISVFLVLIAILFSCQKDLSKNLAVNSSMTNTNAAFALNAGGFISNVKNLNVIYFVPTDNSEVVGYEERLSDLLIHFQEFVKNEMNRNGFGESTFGLPLNTVTNRVKIIKIQAAAGQASYPYDASLSANKIIQEVNAYKALHPNDFSSNYHTLIILPQRSDGGDQPFYGWGRTCFALDNPNISLAAMPTTPSAYIGGLFHELGHGLNLPHDKQKVSEYPLLGTSLMGSGNATFGKTGQKTFLSEGDCAILAKNEIFQPVANPNQYASFTSDIALSEAYFESVTGKMTFTGTFSSSQPISKVLYYFDPITSPTNTDHDSPMWINTPAGNTLHVEIPINDLHALGNTAYNLTIRLLGENGTLNAKTYAFTFLNNIPVFDGKTAVFTQNCAFGGYNFSLPYGAYNSSELLSLGISNNDVSGVRLPMTGVAVRLYDQDSFVGIPLFISNSAACLSGTPYNFNDQASSIIVQPYGKGNTAKFYKHCSYGGTEIELGIGAYTTAELMTRGILDNDISSIKVGENLKITLYEQDFFKGSRFVLQASNSCISSFNDQASSIIIENANE